MEQYFHKITLIHYIDVINYVEGPAQLLWRHPGVQ